MWFRLSPVSTLVPVIAILAISIPVILSPRYLAPDRNDGRPAVVSIHFEPSPVRVGEEVTIVWDVRRTDSISILPVVEDLDPDIGRYTFVATREVFSELKIVLSNRNGETELKLRRWGE